MFRSLDDWIDPRGGVVSFTGLRVRIRRRKFREPDVLALKDAGDARRQDRFWTGADLAEEVVSDDDPTRDLVDKRLDYAQAKVAGYWIVNPFDEAITVLTLGRRKYREHGVFRRGDTATSVAFPGFGVEVNAVLDAK
jgi:Uma2 family endonuclease